MKDFDIVPIEMSELLHNNKQPNHNDVLSRYHGGTSKKKQVTWTDCICPNISTGRDIWLDWLRVRNEDSFRWSRWMQDLINLEMLYDETQSYDAKPYTALTSTMFGWIL